LASARRLLDTLLEIAQVRLELVVTEFEIEKQRWFDALLLALAALFALGVGLVLLCAWLVLVADPAWRLHLLAVMTLLFLGGGLWALRAARARLRGPGTLFDASLTELARDRALLQAALPHDDVR
jgi:uncharacterized membrane protein YqjE